MKTITSPDNALVKKALKLKNPRNRDEHTRCLVEGLRSIETFLNSPYKLARLYVTEEHIEWVKQACDERFFVVVDARIMQKLSAASTPSGVVGIFDIPQQPALTKLSDGIVLAQIQDPGNMGTLIRTATALNKAVILVEGANPYNQKVIQSTAGTIAHARIFRLSWDQLIEHAQAQSLTLSALVVENGIDITTIKDNKKRLLIVGNEAHGLPEEWQTDCNEQITLPMPGGTESLNAAVAGSIALYMLQTK
jgi:TrmH family RNA methyltransferase